MVLSEIEKRLADKRPNILKTDIPKCPKICNMNDYIHKSKLPKIPNMSKYIRKDKIPCWGCNLK